jgi:hypothetical protein
VTDGSWSADVLVIFGIIGDLAHRMTIPGLYELEANGRLDCPIVGVATRPMSRFQLIGLARKAVEESGSQLVESVFARFAARLSYVSGDVGDATLYDALAEHLADYRRPLYYLEVPPHLFEPIAEHLGAAGLLRGSKLAVEKPFGHDLASARALFARLRQLVDERQILRVDHFLGKQPVIELEYLRFANFALDKVWNRDSVTAIEITMAETLSIADRGHFYDRVGALRARDGRRHRFRTRARPADQRLPAGVVRRAHRRRPAIRPAGRHRPELAGHRAIAGLPSAPAALSGGIMGPRPGRHPRAGPTAVASPLAAGLTGREALRRMKEG